MNKSKAPISVAKFQTPPCEKRPRRNKAPNSPLAGEPARGAGGGYPQTSRNLRNAGSIPPSFAEDEKGSGLINQKTEEKYKAYETLLREWNEKMNLVAPSTLTDIRRRHIDDSAQLSKFIPRDKTVLDLGAGAGFPSVVLAILGYKVIAIESIGKKARFLEILKERLNLPNLTIINSRIEASIYPIISEGVFPFPREKVARRAGVGDRAKNNYVFTARAFAPLIKILDITAKFKLPYVLLKGEKAQDEIARAREKYRFRAELTPSAAGPGFVIKLTMK